MNLNHQFVPNFSRFTRIIPSVFELTVGDFCANTYINSRTRRIFVSPKTISYERELSKKTMWLYYLKSCPITRYIANKKKNKTNLRCDFVKKRYEILQSTDSFFYVRHMNRLFLLLCNISACCNERRLPSVVLIKLVMQQ